MKFLDWSKIELLPLHEKIVKEIVANPSVLFETHPLVNLQ